MRVLNELQASYNAKLHVLYAEQYEYGYWASYDEVERIACRDLEPSSEDATKPTSSANIAKPNSLVEERGQKEALRGRWFEPKTVVNVEPDVIILSEITTKPSTLLPKNSVDVVRPSTPSKLMYSGH